MSAQAERTLHVLTGCTAVGKTEWALRWAQARGAEIISCDALLFYRGMDIGTAKPSAAERAMIPHHLIDIRDVSEVMNVAEYARLARAAAEDIAGRGRMPLVVGGSGFYLRSFFAPVADEVGAEPAVRARVSDLFEKGGLAALLAELERLNPAGLGELDRANPRRVVRALERCFASGLSMRELAEKFARLPAPFAGWRTEITRLELPQEELDRRIALRTSAMLRAGLVQEVRGLLETGLRGNPSAMRAIGYRETIAMLEGSLAPELLEAEIIRDTRALVKKQRTWFRTQLPAHAVTSG